MADYNRSNTVEDLLRRYNLDGVTKKVTQIQGELINTNGILEDFVETTTENLDLINDQLDGNVTSWFYDYVPTLLNVPASGWTTDELKDEHLEDLFYDSSTGKVYKFVKDGDTYQWVEVTNIIGAQTFAIANASQDVLDGNRRTFFTTPTPPYDVGDLWADNTNHILYRCLTPKATGETFAAADWVDSLKYLSTDDGDKLVDSINSRKTTKTIGADRLFIEGDEINMTSKQLSIKSDNFDLEYSGALKIKNTAVFGGNFQIENGIEGAGWKYVSLTANGFGFVEETTGGLDQYYFIGEYSNGNRGFHFTKDGSYLGCYVTQNTPSFEILSKRLLAQTMIASEGVLINGYDNIYMNSGIRCQIMNTGMNFKNISTGEPYNNTHYKVTSCYVEGSIQAAQNMYAQQFIPASIEEKKKNIEPIDVKALDIIKDIDIYKYNYKNEKDEDKKHYGFVIGNNYNYSKEVTDNKNSGADLYSFVSVCCKAIQEQQKEIEELKEEISKLKEGRQ